MIIRTLHTSTQETEAVGLHFQSQPEPQRETLFQKGKRLERKGRKRKQRERKGRDEKKNRMRAKREGREEERKEIN